MVRLSRAVVALSTLVLTLPTLAGCGGKPAQRGGAPPVAVETAPVMRSDIATYLTLDGQITPLQDSQLSLAQSGAVVGVYVVEGQRVTRGQVLAKIDDSTLRANLAQAQAQVSGGVAKVGGSTLQNPITQQNVQTNVITAQQALANAKNNTAAAQAAYTNAKLLYDGNVSLFKQGYVSQTALEQSRSAYVAAQQTLANDKELEGSAQAQLANTRTGTLQTKIQAQQVNQDRASLEQSRALVQLYSAQIAQTTLTAPFDGVITARLLDPGAYAGPNQPIARISQIDTVYVNANIPDDQLSFVTRGTSVTFTTSSLPGKTFLGRIDEVNATPTQGTLSYRARIKQPNPGNLLRGGMLVSLSVRKEFHPNAIVVPRTAIFQTDAGASVFTVVDGDAPAGGAAGAAPPAGGAQTGPPPKKAAQVPVKIGLQTDTMTEVLSGVEPGTTVITTRPDALQNGSVVAAVGGPGGPGGAAGAAPPGGAKGKRGAGSGGK